MFSSRRLTSSAISLGLHVIATSNPSQRSRSAASTRYLRSRPTSSTRGSFSSEGMELLLLVTGCRTFERQAFARRDPDAFGLAGRELEDRAGAAVEAQAPRPDGR